MKGAVGVWLWTGMLLVLLAVVGLVTFDLLAHYWAGRFQSWTDLRHHLLYLVGIRNRDRALHGLRGRADVRRQLSAKVVRMDRRAAGCDQEHR